MYLELLKKLGIRPNFWCSKEYWEKAGWKEVVTKINDERYYWMMSDSGVMLPVISEHGGIAANPYWAGFSSMNRGEFLDYEFIYKPIPDINDLPGRNWKTTRKNIHKVESEHGRLELKDLKDVDQDMIAGLIADWVPSDKLIHDSDTMADYLLSGENRLSLWIGDEFVGIIVWDENWKYVNFRYCVVKSYPGLSDYARILFHHHVYQIRPEKLINDGGSLDRELLYKYKKRLNPVEINKIYSTL